MVLYVVAGCTAVGLLAAMYDVGYKEITWKEFSNRWVPHRAAPPRLQPLQPRQWNGQTAAGGAAGAGLHWLGADNHCSPGTLKP